jgi:uncharacterized repeat protein (TIGR03803 family)
LRHHEKASTFPPRKWFAPADQFQEKTMRNLRIPAAAILFIGLLNCRCYPSATNNVMPTVLYSFTGGADGGTPESGLIQATDGNFYGTTSQGGASNTGTVFRITSAGMLTTLYSFTGGADGAVPLAGLIEGTDSNFYGTTSQGGTGRTGTVFRITSAGLLTTLYSFTGGADGGLPLGGVIQATNGILYGTTAEGGAFSTGTVFQITTAGTFSTLFSFAGTNGATPEAGLIQGTDGNFYGTTSLGGTNLTRNAGTAFQITPAGTLTTLSEFSLRVGGRYPRAALIQGVDGSFYGTTQYGGGANDGVMFAISLNTTGIFNEVFQFGGPDGRLPQSPLIQGRDGYFYGATFLGGYNYGSIFQIASNGVISTLSNFLGGTDGGVPYGPLVEATNGYFYGTTGYGGPNLHGTVFRFAAFPAGSYNGLAIQNSAPSQVSSGFLKLTMSPSGYFTAGLTMGGLRSAFNGQLDVAGDATNTVPRGNLNPLQVIMHLDKDGGSNVISGIVSDGVFTSDLMANLAGFSLTNECPEFGQFTFNLAPANTNDTTVPQGFGYGTMSVSRRGIGRVHGVLGDGTPFSATAPVSGLNTFPLYAQLYGNKGACLGFLNFPTTNSITATLDWFKPPIANAHFFPDGFNTSVTMTGARYITPVRGVPSIAGNVELTLGGGNLPSNIVKNAVIDAAGNVTVSRPGSDELALSIAPGNGLITGTFRPPSNRTTFFNGYLLQTNDFGAGLFFGTDQTGFILIEPTP